MRKCQEKEENVQEAYRINGRNDDDAADDKEGLHFDRVLSRLDVDQRVESSGKLRLLCSSFRWK